jgi:chemotaxis protein methyltransferase CheR
MLTLGVNSKPKLSSEVFTQLRELIYSRCGISFADSKKYLLESRLAKRLELRNLKNFDDYYCYLMYDRSKEEEISVLVNTIVTNETSFFRDQAQLDAFQKGVVPKLVEVKKRAMKRTIRVWSAACSTGEEPYTLAMMLMEALGPDGWTLEVIGSDISDNVLNSAKKAAYEQYSLRNAPPAFLSKYFSNSSGGVYTVKEDVQRLVKYRKINLMNSFETRLVNDIDVVFCRNVLIYFDDVSKKKAVSHLYDSLVKGGYLFVGFSESLHNVTRLFRPVSIDGALVHQKI